MAEARISPPEEAQNRLFRLIELARLARHAESAAALQFMLVNQTHQLCPYLIAAFWVEDEGIVAQSGVSKVERNAPFVQWLSGVCAQLAPQTEPLRVTPDLLSEDDIIEWRDALPAFALWLPIKAVDQPTAGLLLARQDSWEDADIALLVEWLDIWRHAWAKLYAPSLHGEFSKGVHRIRRMLPDQDTLWQEAAAIKGGTQHFVNEVVRQPRRWPTVLGQFWVQIKARLQGFYAIIKEKGLVGLFDAACSEAKAIWADKRRRISWIVGIVLLFPVRLSVLAPAELVPAHPAIIRVPIEGVVDEFFVAPNQQVAEGQPLFRLDLTTLTSRFNVAQQETQIAASEYRQSALQSLTDAKSRTQLLPQEGKAAERKVEADYLKELIAKAQIKSPRAGIALFDDPSEWIGRPVVAGEKVMVVASEGDAEIEAWVPIGDAIALPKEAPVSLYLNAMPLSPVDGHLRFIGHEALQRPDGSYAYRLRATLNAGEHAPHVGLKGTAKISGEFVPLVYWVLRKPLATVRQFFGI